MGLIWAPHPLLGGFQEAQGLILGRAQAGHVRLQSRDFLRATCLTHCGDPALSEWQTLVTVVTGRWEEAEGIRGSPTVSPGFLVLL